ncbi:hypothetical protein ES705_28077 [subsurface metagenome]
MLPVVFGLFAGLSLVAGRLFSGDAVRRRQTRKAKRKAKKAARKTGKLQVTKTSTKERTQSLKAGGSFDLMNWLKANWFIPLGVLVFGIGAVVLLGGKKKKVGKRRSRKSNPGSGSSSSSTRSKSQKSSGSRASSPAMRSQQNKMKAAARSWKKAGKPGTWKAWVKKELKK